MFVYIAAKFLHENGVILHFNDHLRGLNNLFFVDPSWLIDIVALIVTVRQRNPVVQCGSVKQKDLMKVLKNPRLPDNFIPQVFIKVYNSFIFL